MQRIMVKLAFKILLLLWYLDMLQESAASARVAKPNCTETCGNVTIPFPFGIGKECFLDEWYEIVCESNDTLPVLKKIGLYVYNITLPDYHRQTDGLINISLPIFYSSNASCGVSSPSAPVNLTGSNFVFSQARDTYTSVGCNVLSLLKSIGSNAVGCMPACDTANYSRNTGCWGNDGCCETTIPLNLQVFNVEFRDEGGSEGCKFAFLMDMYWFRNLSASTHNLMSFNFVPSSLEWGIAKDSDYLNGLDSPSSTFTCEPHSFNTKYPENNPVLFTQCYCTLGYAGNAYLPGGCRDINECEDPDLKRWCTGTCVNRLGSFDCVHGGKTIKTILIGVGSSVGALLLFLLSWWLYKVIKKRREIKLKEKYFKRNGGLLLQQQLSSPNGDVEKSKLFSSTDLDRATDHFNESRIVGQGGQGTVYKGMLADGRIVAVKKSTVIDEGKVEQFINEVIILSQINHRNVVKLYGCCLETEIPLLVYEFIPNGTLYQYLQDPAKDFPVSWDMRLRIAAEISGALAYLHSSASIPIFHRDIKSINILLDEKFHAKIADFGTSKHVSLNQTHVTTLVQGTFGYLDPQYFQTSRFTDKSDVYSFGVVLVELLTGQKPISPQRVQEGRNLAADFITSMQQNCLLDIVDAQVLKEGKKEEVMTVANLAKKCLNLYGRNRPTMKEVARELEGIRKPQKHSSFQPSQETGDMVESYDTSFIGSNSESDGDTGTIYDSQPLLFCETE